MSFTNFHSSFLSEVANANLKVQSVGFQGNKMRKIHIVCLLLSAKWFVTAPSQPGGDDSFSGPRVTGHTGDPHQNPEEKITQIKADPAGRPGPVL